MVARSHTLRCPLCQGPTSTKARQATQHCDFCGFEFVDAPSPQDLASAEAVARAELQRRFPKLDDSLRDARRAIERGEREEAWALVTQWVQAHSDVYEQCGYATLMGLDDEARRSDFASAWATSLFEHLEASVRGSSPASPSRTLESSFARALESQDFPALVSSYRQLCEASMSRDMRWRHRSRQEWTSAIDQALRSLALSLHWVDEQQLASIGARRQPLRTGPRGALAAHCANCGAQVPWSQEATSAPCPYCAATIRVSSPSRSEPSPFERPAVRALDALLQRAAACVAGQAEPGSSRERELSFYYALELNEPASDIDESTLRDALSLGSTLLCRHCQNRVALDADSTECPLCRQRP